MLGIRTRRPPPFGGIHVSDDKDIQVHRPEEASRDNLWSEGRLLLRDLIFALMAAALVVVFIVQPVKVEGTSMLPRLHDGERIFVNKLIYYDEYRWAPRIERGSREYERPSVNNGNPLVVRSKNVSSASLCRPRRARYSP